MNWRDYEHQIHQRLTDLAGPESVVSFDQKLQGKVSGVSRQVDVLVEGAFANETMRGIRLAVDCKCWSTGIDVADVDAFIGFLGDLPVDLGLLATTKSFSEGAKKRAQGARGVRLEIIPYADSRDWALDIHLCDVCDDPDSDRLPGAVWWATLPATDGPAGGHLVTALGTCDRCATLHMLCRCGAVTSRYEAQDNQWVECQSGCGVQWLVSDNELDAGLLPRNQEAFHYSRFRRIEE
jgi:hypothetical protein